MTQREMFEKWYNKKTNNNGGVAYYVELWGEYCYEDIQLAWESWQASCPEGWQAVPKRMDRGMMSAAIPNEECVWPNYGPQEDEMQQRYIRALQAAPKTFKEED